MNEVEAQVIEYIHEHAIDALTPDKSRKGYICPICSSGSGENGTGITTKDGKHFSCWKGCFTNSDFIDIIGLRDGLTDFREKLEAACNELRVNPEKIPFYRQSNAGKRAKKMDEKQKQKGNEENYSNYYAECHKRLQETDYAQKRGLSSTILERFNIGYDPAWQHPKVVAEGKNTPASPRLIIPTSASSYLARDTREEIPEKQRKYSKSKVGNVHIFNLEALEDTETPCFVVEGEIDALSIIEVGGNALALGSVSNVGKLLMALESLKPKQPIMIALDNDDAGEQASKKLETGLKKQGISFYRNNSFEEFKDANEALQKNPEALKKAVEAAKQAGIDEKEEYLRTSTAAYIQRFIDGIADSVNTPCVSTGFSLLDQKLDGGLYEGLYIMGAISSLGKTTFALQICDQIAAAGNDVLIFSLEMARTQLMSKSISRHTFTIAHEMYNTPKEADKAGRIAKTGRGITDGRRYINYSREEKELIKSAVNAYKEYAGRIFVHEGIGDIGIEQIRKMIELHINVTGRKPIVMIDYLQILAPYNERYSDKQNTDKAVLELRRISRDFKIAVIAISSLNRMSYKDKIDMAAFKESGAIEYSADCLIGLQLKDAGSNGFNATEAKKKDPRDIELVILKNREAAVGDAVSFAYYPRFNLFEENKKG